MTRGNMDSLHDTKRTLTVGCGAGLSNRLRVLVSGLVIAAQTHRAFTAHWPHTHSCSCAFHELFTNAWNVQATRLLETQTTHDLSFRRWRKLPDLLAASETNLSVKHHSWLLFPDRFPYHAAHMQDCIQLFSELEPVPEIAARIESFQQTFFRAPVIGVHLRRGDMLWLSPDTTNNTDATMHAVHNFLLDAPNALIFLCTDDGAPNPVLQNDTPYEGIREKFKRRFGARVIWNEPRSLDRRTPEALQDALVDLWLLRCTDYFVGTARSSFSELAIFGRSIPHVLTMQALPHYAKTERWLRRLHLDGIVKQLGIEDGGQAEPLPMLWYKYSRRALFHARKIRRAF